MNRNFSLKTQLKNTVYCYKLPKSEEKKFKQLITKCIIFRLQILVKRGNKK